MKTNKISISGIVQRILTGKITPFSFLILLGFIASLTLLYIYMQVHCSSLSERINSCSREMRSLRKQNIRLTVEYNQLIKPERIIPRALKLGMKRGSSHSISDLTLERNQRLFREKRAENSLAESQFVSNSSVGRE